MEEMEEHNFLEMVALALEDDKGCCWAYVMYDKHYLSDYLEVESQSATNVTIHPLGLELFEDTFENTQWRNIKQMQQLRLNASALNRHWKTHTGERPNKCNQCDYATSCADVLKTHLKTHSGKSQTNATNANMHALLQAIWGHIYEKTQWWKAEQMRPIWLCILLRKCFEDAFENSQWRKAEQM